MTALFGNNDKKEEIPLTINKPELDVTDITRRDLAMLYLGIALETRRNFGNRPEVNQFMIKTLRKAVLASVPEYTPEQIEKIQKNIKKSLLQGIFMRELDKAVSKLLHGKNPYED